VRDNQIVSNELYTYDEASSRFVSSNSNPYSPKLRNFSPAGRWL